MMTKWGYKETGESRLFEVDDADAPLPVGWSDDHMIIAEPDKRTGDAITSAAGPSVMTPVKIMAQEDAARRAPYRPIQRDKS